jgi:Flp pilus assembly pilin Flp
MSRHNCSDCDGEIRSHPSILRRLLADEQGGEVIEYVLIAGLIIVATIATIAGFGGKVLARWTSVNQSM